MMINIHPKASGKYITYGGDDAIALWNQKAHIVSTPKCYQCGHRATYLMGTRPNDHTYVMFVCKNNKDNKHWGNTHIYPLKLIAQQRLKIIGSVR